MGRTGRTKNDGQRAKQERERRYQLNADAKAKKRERDRVYQQKKREQTRLWYHEDPLAQLADTTTQQNYLQEENEYGLEVTVTGSMDKETEATDVGGTVEEMGEVLENVAADVWEGGFNYDWGRDIDDEIGCNTNGSGMDILKMTNSRGEC
jgi:hypothetical protein